MNKRVLVVGKLVGTGKAQEVQAPVVEDVFVHDTIAMIKRARKLKELNAKLDAYMRGDR